MNKLSAEELAAELDALKTVFASGDWLPSEKRAPAMIEGHIAAQDEMIARLALTCSTSGADFKAIGALCEIRDDEYPLKAVERVVTRNRQLEAELAEARAALATEVGINTNLTDRLLRSAGEVTALRAVVEASPIVCGEPLIKGDPDTPFCGRLTSMALNDRTYCWVHAPAQAIETGWASSVRGLEALEREGHSPTCRSLQAECECHPPKKCDCAEREATKPKTATFPALPISEDDEAIVDALKAKREGGRSIPSAEALDGLFGDATDGEAEGSGDG